MINVPSHDQMLAHPMADSQYLPLSSWEDNLKMSLLQSWLPGLAKACVRIPSWFAPTPVNRSFLISTGVASEGTSSLLSGFETPVQSLLPGETDADPNCLSLICQLSV